MACAESLRISTARGAAIEVVADLPPGAGPFPALILAPGQSYHMRRPVLERTARHLVEQGVAVYRFDWAYYSRNPKTGEPSAGYVDELDDLRAVVELARQDKRIAPARISVGGKSLGSLVAWRLFSQDKTLRAGLFLTPVCSRVEPDRVVSLTDENYPGLARESRPLAFVAGDRDHWCAPAVLYGFAAGGRNVRVAVVGGDHSFRIRRGDGSEDEAAQGRILTAVAQFAAGFVLDGEAP